MKYNIGIVCEGPTDFIVLKKVIDHITGEANTYVQLQPESDLTGKYGNGWKGVWKWCHDNAKIRKKLMLEVEPVLNLLVIQMDGDVSRREKSSHCWCECTECEYKGIRNPLECDVGKENRDACPISLPCKNHSPSIEGYMSHLRNLITSWLTETDKVCIVIPCDSTEAWIVAAYDQLKNVEYKEDPWKNIISRKKVYHDIRIPGHQKRILTYSQFAETVCLNWNTVTDLCQSARIFENDILSLTNQSF